MLNIFNTSKLSTIVEMFFFWFSINFCKWETFEYLATVFLKKCVFFKVSES